MPVEVWNLHVDKVYLHRLEVHAGRQRFRGFRPGLRFLFSVSAMENARRHLVGASWLGESEHKDHKAHIKWPKRLKLFCQFSVGAATASTSNCWTASAKHVGLLAATAFGAHTQWPRIWRYEMREDKQHSAHRRTTCESEEMSESIAQLTATCNTFFEALLHLSRDWHWKWQPQIAGIFLHGYPGRESATTNFGSRFASSISDPEHCTNCTPAWKALSMSTRKSWCDYMEYANHYILTLYRLTVRIENAIYIKSINFFGSFANLRKTYFIYI